MECLRRFDYLFRITVIIDSHEITKQNRIVSCFCDRAGGRDRPESQDGRRDGRAFQTTPSPVPPVPPILPCPPCESARTFPYIRIPAVRREVHRWYSDRVRRDMGVIVLGHWGPPMIMFPTSGGDEGEYERMSLIGTIAGFIDSGRVKVFCVNTNHHDSFANRGAHPFHRSLMQRMYDEYIRQEV